MANKIVLKKSAVAGKTPLTTDLDYGEIALNYADGKLYFKNASNAVQSFGTTSFTKITSNTTAVAGKSYLADTSGGTFTVTLPASPATGDTVIIADGANFNTTALTVGRNSQTIEGIAQDLSLNISSVSVTLVYDGATWEVYTQVGAQGGTAGGGDVTLSGTQTLTNKTLTSPVLTTPSITGDATSSGLVSLTYTGAASTSTLSIDGYNSKGGTGYHDFLKVTNGYGSATNPNKWFRLNSTGGLEIVNSAYTSTLFYLNDTGDLVLAGNLTMDNRPAFRVVGNGGQISATTTLTSSHWTLDYQQGSALNTSTGIFTAPKAGLYQTHLVMRTAANNNSGINQAIIRKTAASGGAVTSQAMLEFGVNTSMNHAGVGTIVRMAVGDTLKVDVTGGTLSFDGNDNWSVAYIG